MPDANLLEVFWTKQANEDLAFWRKNQAKTVAKIEALIAECRADAFHGTGKPEALKYEWQGYWSRRITGEHRLIYRVEDGVLYIAQCRFHY